MRDMDVRAPLIRELLDSHDDDTLIVDEFALCQGDVRVDVAVINGALNGFEIKSDSDTLDRLPAQEAIYSRVLDTVTVIAGQKHVEGVLGIVPPWWGVRQATLAAGRVAFKTVRRCGRNPAVDPYSLAQLLWRDEALQVIGQIGLTSDLSRKPRRELWRAIAENVSIPQLRAHVRQLLKSRTAWRSAV